MIHLVIILALSLAVQGGQPNILFILTDDEGWDDVGRNNQYVKTPNIDKFIKQSTLFDNMYVTPQCAQTRSELLTGRWHPRTGTMGVSGGWDFVNTNEVNIANVLGGAGYKTAHFGKWHPTTEVMGYEPRFCGFQDSYIEGFFGDNAGAASALMVHNGRYYLQQTEGGRHLAQDMLLKNIILRYLDKPESSSQPFFIYFAARAIHVNLIAFTATGELVLLRVSPPSYSHRYYNNPKYAGVPNATLDAWAYLEYLDDAVGDLFNQLEANGMVNSTYIFLIGDNGSALLDGEDGPSKQYRMPSGMRGNKGTVYEGGIRNFLAVSGPGVEMGTIVSTLIDIKDILPTIAELAGVDARSSDHLPWDGISFKNLLLPGRRASMDSSRETGSTNTSSSHTYSTIVHRTSNDVPLASTGDLPKSSGNVGSTSASASASASEGTQQPDKATSRQRGRRVATKEQKDRILVTLDPRCWSANAVPLLDKDRNIIKSQPLLSFDSGGIYWAKAKPRVKPPATGPGIQKCIAVRWRDYKYIGETDTVYSFAKGGLPHDESEQNEVSGPNASYIKAKLVSAARSWWQSLLAEPHSFLKPTFYLGLGDSNVTNMLAAGAHERTPGAITLTVNGATGFENVGDRMCLKINVTKADRYQIVPLYTSRARATFKMSFGTFQEIQAGTAPSLTAQLPPQSTMRGMVMGYRNLNESQGGKTEACLELVETEAPGKPVFQSLGSIRITRLPRQHWQKALSLELPSSVSTGSSSQGSSNSNGDSSSSDSNMSHGDTPTAQPAPGLDFAQDYSWLLSSIAPDAPPAEAAAPASAETAWRQFRYKHRLPDGQDVLESLYSPYDAEGIEECSSWMECKPQI